MKETTRKGIIAIIGLPIGFFIFILVQELGGSDTLAFGFAFFVVILWGFYAPKLLIDSD